MELNKNNMNMAGLIEEELSNANTMLEAARKEIDEAKATFYTRKKEGEKFFFAIIREAIFDRASYKKANEEKEKEEKMRRSEAIKYLIEAGKFVDYAEKLVNSASLHVDELLELALSATLTRKEGHNKGQPYKIYIEWTESIESGIYNLRKEIDTLKKEIDPEGSLLKELARDSVPNVDEDIGVFEFDVKNSTTAWAPKRFLLKDIVISLLLNPDLEVSFLKELERGNIPNVDKSILQKTKEEHKWIFDLLKESVVTAVTETLKELMPPINVHIESDGDAYTFYILEKSYKSEKPEERRIGLAKLSVNDWTKTLKIVLLPYFYVGYYAKIYNDDSLIKRTMTQTYPSAFLPENPERKVTIVVRDTIARHLDSILNLSGKEELAKLNYYVKADVKILSVTSFVDLEAISQGVMRMPSKIPLIVDREEAVYIGLNKKAE